MTTKERLEMMIVRLEKEQKEIIKAVNETESIDFIIGMGKQAEKKPPNNFFCSCSGTT